MNRDIKTELKYRKWKKKLKMSQCIFCRPPKHQIVQELKRFYILKNNYPYAIWDYRRVIDHLLIASKEHVKSLSELTPDSKEEYIRILSQFEKEGYNLYTRTDSNKSKSVAHFHTHLIKTGNQTFNSLIYQKEPYISKPKFD